MKCPKCGYNSFEFLDSCKKCSSDLTGFKQAHGIQPLVIPAPVTTANDTAPQAAFASPAAATVTPPQETSSTDSDETFTWDTPAAQETAKQGDDIFPDLDLGLSETANAEPAAETFSFDTEPAATTPAAVEEESPFGDFSFDEAADAQNKSPATTPGTTMEESFTGLLETSDSNIDSAAIQPAAPALDLENSWDAPEDTFGGFSGKETASDTITGALPADEGATGEFDLESFGWEEEKTAPAPSTKGPQVDMEGFAPDEFEKLFGDPDETGKTG